MSYGKSLIEKNFAKKERDESRGDLFKGFSYLHPFWLLFSIICMDIADLENEENLSLVIMERQFRAYILPPKPKG